MAVTSVTYSDFVTTDRNSASLPTFFQNAPASFVDVSCTLPDDTLPNGIFAFTYATDKTHDSSVGIQFSLDAPNVSWGLATTLQEFRSMHWAVP